MFLSARRIDEQAGRFLRLRIDLSIRLLQSFAAHRDIRQRQQLHMLGLLKKPHRIRLVERTHELEQLQSQLALRVTLCPYCSPMTPKVNSLSSVQAANKVEKPCLSEAAQLFNDNDTRCGQVLAMSASGHVLKSTQSISRCREPPHRWRSISRSVSSPPFTHNVKDFNVPPDFSASSDTHKSLICNSFLPSLRENMKSLILIIS